MSPWMKLTCLLPLAICIESRAAAQAPQEEGAVPLPADFTSDSTEESGDAAADASASGSAEAASDAGPLRLYAGFALNVGGRFVDMKGGGSDLGAEPTPGLQLGADYVLMDFVALGAELRLSWAGTSNDYAPWNYEKRIMFTDFVVKPRGRYRFHGLPLEVYGALPVGLALANMPDSTLAGRETQGKASATLGVTAGAYYFFSEHLGVNAEVGWQWHWLRFEETWNDQVFAFSGRLGQLQLLAANFVFAF